MPPDGYTGRLRLFAVVNEFKRHCYLMSLNDVESQPEKFVML